MIKLIAWYQADSLCFGLRFYQIVLTIFLKGIRASTLSIAMSFFVAYNGLRNLFSFYLNLYLKCVFLSFLIQNTSIVACMYAFGFLSMT